MSYKIFADLTTADPAALSQFYEAMKQPFAVKGAVMPDVHKGYSLPIGSVVATRGVIVPSWVGYDIGCGVGAMKLNIDSRAILDRSDEVYELIKQRVPMGTSKHKDPVLELATLISPRTAISKSQYSGRGAELQLGTLGGGNHFIEIGEDHEHSLWVIIHSGSRGTGHGIAGEYMKLASRSDKAKEGHYPLFVDCDEGRDYIYDLKWALEYALLNRRAMLRIVREALQELLGTTILTKTFINRNHNHAELKGGLWIHRKGATHADAGMYGVIPGNMRDGSFIVIGRGNEDALCSSSHGAGRVLGRNKASKTLSLEEFQHKMNGIRANVSQGTLDESPMAYKNIFEVMEMQKDLVDVVAHIKPIINLKG